MNISTKEVYDCIQNMNMITDDDLENELVKSVRRRKEKIEKLKVLENKVSKEEPLALTEFRKRFCEKKKLEVPSQDLEEHCKKNSNKKKNKRKAKKPTQDHSKEFQGNTGDGKNMVKLNNEKSKQNNLSSENHLSEMIQKLDFCKITDESNGLDGNLKVTSTEYANETDFLNFTDSLLDDISKVTAGLNKFKIYMTSDDSNLLKNKTQLFLKKKIDILIEELHSISVNLSVDFSNMLESNTKKIEDKVLDCVTSTLTKEDDRNQDLFLGTSDRVTFQEDVKLDLNCDLLVTESPDLDPSNDPTKAESGNVKNKKADMNEEINLKLQHCFPDADPKYIATMIEDHAVSGTLDNNTVNEIINELLDSDYPRLESVCEITKRKLLWNDYVVNFSAEEFILEFPNPETLKEPTDLDLRFKFLKSRYPTVPDENILNLPSTSELNKICQDFDINHTPIRLKESEFQFEKFDKQFLVKATSIDHATDIELYMADINIRKEFEDIEADSMNAYLECRICVNKLIPSNVVQCPEAHTFCRECITRYIEVKIADSRYEFPCPEECCSFLSDDSLQKILPKKIYRKILNERQYLEVSKANVDGLEHCLSCNFAYIPASESKIFQCQNEECLAEFCRKCRRPNHLPKNCYEVNFENRQQRAKKEIEETMTEALVRKCPECQTQFIRDDGCNKMKCVCGKMICYKCNKLIKGYSHFNQGSCPLYSNNYELHTQKVQEAGKRAKERILLREPDLRIGNYLSDDLF